jgi:hypothetical protein
LIRTSVSTNIVLLDSVAEAATLLKDRLGEAAPSLVIAYFTEDLALPALAVSLQAQFPNAAIFGGTTCRGVISQDGVFAQSEGVLGLMAVSDAGGAFGVGSAWLGDNPRAAATSALEQALLAAGRPYETPGLLMICQPRGEEERVLEGIADLVGLGCPIIGGSSADEAIAGGWRQLCGPSVLENHVVIAAQFPSAPSAIAFQSGYAPTGLKARVTASAGREVLELDGMSAGKRYAELTGGIVPVDATGLILAESTAAPLARVAGRDGGADEYILSHPARITSEGALALFTEALQGEELLLMSGERSGLIERAGRVVRDATRLLELDGATVAGGLVIYCAGCMLHVSDQLAEIHESLVDAFGGASFLTAFTFGEQGSLASAGNRHGNLMVSAGLYGRTSD